MSFKLDWHKQDLIGHSPGGETYRWVMFVAYGHRFYGSVIADEPFHYRAGAHRTGRAADDLGEFDNALDGMRAVELAYEAAAVEDVMDRDPGVTGTLTGR